MFRVDRDDVRVGDLFKDNRCMDTVYRTVTQVCTPQNVVLDENGESHSTFRTFFRHNGNISHDRQITSPAIHHEGYSHTTTKMTHTLRRNRAPFVGILVDARRGAQRHTKITGTCSMVLDQRMGMLHMRFGNHTYPPLSTLEGVWLVRLSAEENASCARWTSEHNTPRSYVSMHAIQNESHFATSVHFSTPDQYGVLVVE